MAISEKERKQLMAVLAALPLLGIVAFWMYVRTPRSAEIAETRHTIDSLRAAVDSARQDLASGTVEQLRERVTEYEGSLQLMRQLVPTDNEVATLINDISDRAKLRGVYVDVLTPLGKEQTGRFLTDRYRFVVYGHFDALGGFLSDIASLPRIMVPRDLSLQPAPEQAARSLGDTTGALLQATFQLRAFVKQPASATSEEGGPGGSR